jgi:hypothetical protein
MKCFLFGAHHLNIQSHVAHYFVVFEVDLIENGRFESIIVIAVVVVYLFVVVVLEVD